MWTWHGSVLLDYLPIDHRYYLTIFNVRTRVGSKNTFEWWMMWLTAIKIVNSQILNIEHIEPMSTGNLYLKLRFFKMNNMTNLAKSQQKFTMAVGVRKCCLSRCYRRAIREVSLVQTRGQLVMSLPALFVLHGLYVWDYNSSPLCVSSIILLYAESLALYLVFTIQDTIKYLLHPSVISSHFKDKDFYLQCNWLFAYFKILGTFAATSNWCCNCGFAQHDHC